MADKTIILDGIVLDSVVADMSGNVYCVAAHTYPSDEGYDDYVAYAAYHYDKRIGELNTIISDVSYSDCVAATVKYREGVRY
jgi:hypothetical protein